LVEKNAIFDRVKNPYNDAVKIYAMYETAQLLQHAFMLETKEVFLINIEKFPETILAHCKAPLMTVSDYLSWNWETQM
jgi:hypothetical protein